MHSSGSNLLEKLRQFNKLQYTLRFGYILSFGPSATPSILHRERFPV